MRVVKDNAQLQDALSCLNDRSSLALVPTMGFLHAGHLNLVRLAMQRARHVLVSIFVNPTQFNSAEDLSAYPSDLERDLDQLRDLGVDIVFTPDKQSIYGKESLENGFQSWVTVERLSAMHEGEFRPGHFRGVSTVVSILFNLIKPSWAVFGEKDFQQLRIIEQMVQDLHYDLEILRAPLMREKDGLALSSRNVRLSSQERQAGTLLSRGIQRTQTAFQEGERSSEKLCLLAREIIQHSPLNRIEYLRIINEEDLKEVQHVKAEDRLILAVQVGAVRLIDNAPLGRPIEFDLSRRIC